MPSIQVNFPADIYMELENERIAAGLGVTEHYARLIHEARAHRIENSKPVEQAPTTKQKKARR